MQAKAVAFTINPILMEQTIEEGHPALNIWQTLYYELVAAGHSKQQIADWLQLSPRSIDRLLIGSTKQPSYKVLSRMLHAYCYHSLGVK
jgi:hypothetical protein